MRIVRSLAILALLAAPVAFAPLAAHADLIHFGSGVNTVTYTNTFGSGTAVIYDSTTPYGVGSYVAPVSGTSYITWNDSHDESLVPAGDTSYTILLDGGTEGGYGSVSFAADNSVVVFLNGNQIGSSSTFNSLTSDNLALLAGTNTLTFVVTNTVAAPGDPNPTALDFGGSFTPVPEPSSIALLGTGLFSVAGFARRKFRS